MWHKIKSYRDCIICRICGSAVKNRTKKEVEKAVAHNAYAASAAACVAPVICSCEYNKRGMVAFSVMGKRAGRKE